MTGEVTLRGKVLEIGGLKEKIYAAYRAGLREVIMPATNEKDLREIPDEIRKVMTFTFVSTMDEVVRTALLPKAVTDAPVAAPAATMADLPEKAEVSEKEPEARDRAAQSPESKPAD